MIRIIRRGRSGQIINQNKSLRWAVLTTLRALWLDLDGCVHACPAKEMAAWRRCSHGPLPVAQHASILFGLLILLSRISFYIFVIHFCFTILRIGGTQQSLYLSFFQERKSTLMSLVGTDEGPNQSIKKDGDADEYLCHN